MEIKNHQFGTGFSVHCRMVSAVKRPELVNYRIWLITEFNTYCWCDVVLNVHATNEDKRNDSKDSFYEELEQVLLA
jgi:hypothetical protein